MTLRGRAMATSVHSPLLTPTRSFRDDFQLGDMAALPPLNNNSSRSTSNTSRYYGGNSKKPLDPQDASLSALDQLHAEQKSTIEALTYQIEFYRQREERSKKEVEALRSFVQNNNSDEAAISVARLARDNRALGDEVDALRSKQAVWSDEKMRSQRHQHELEHQLQDARLSLTTFTQAVEQLELKMQRRDAEEQTRALAMEQELHQRDEECAQLRRECEGSKNEMESMRTAKAENEKLRRELQTLAHSTTTQRTTAEATTLKMQRELSDVQQQLREAEARGRQREASVLELQTKLVQATSEASSAQIEMEKKGAAIRELEQKLQRSTELLELREKLLTSDASTRYEGESQRQDLRQKISILEHDKSVLQRELEAREQLLQTAAIDMDAMKARLAAKDHGVMIATLRSEVAGVKERLRAEFKHEKEALQIEKSSLSKEITLLNTRISEKERFIHRLQDEMLEKESNEQRASREVNTLQNTIRRLETEVSNAQSRYQQLLGARSSLADQLDHGFKELLEDEDTAASLLQRMEKLHEELSDTKQQLVTSEASRTTVAMELEAAKQEQENVSTALRRKIDELYDDLRKKDEGAFDVKELERKVYFLEQEKRTFEFALSNQRTELEDRISAEQDAGEKLRETISVLKTEKAQQHAKIIAVEDELTGHDAKVQELKAALERRDQKLATSTKEITIMQNRIRQVEDELRQAHDTIISNQEEKSKRERKLLRERRLLEEQVAKLVERIETASTRNGELGDKIISLMKQLKGYEAEMIALRTQLKAEKQKRNDVDRVLASVQRSVGQEAESADDLKRRLHEITSLKESYQGEVHQLKRSLERAQGEKDGVHRQRDEAIKRVSMLMKCQEQMKSTVESHTVELIEEIETLQGQLDDERKRTTVFLANEKTLLRDITEKNATIGRLQQTVAVLQQHEQELSSGARPELRKVSLRDGRYSSFPPSVSPTARGPTTPKTSNGSEVSSSTQELDRILGNLERISEFSTRSPSASFTT